MQKYVGIVLLFFIAIFSCEDSSGDSDDNDIISVLYPANGIIIQDSVLISLEIQDKTNVLKVELWMNGDSTSIHDYTAPFSLKLDTKSYEKQVSGPKIAAKASVRAGNADSDRKNTRSN